MQSQSVRRPTHLVMFFCWPAFVSGRWSIGHLDFSPIRVKQVTAVWNSLPSTQWLEFPMKPLLVALSLATALSMAIAPTDAGRADRPGAQVGDQASASPHPCNAAARARARRMPAPTIAVLENLCRNTRRQNPTYALFQMQDAARLRNGEPNENS
jgi:hypothetical protein